MSGTFSIRIYDKEIDDWITEQAKKEDRKRNYIINRMLKDAYELRTKKANIIPAGSETGGKK